MKLFNNKRKDKGCVNSITCTCKKPQFFFYVLAWICKKTNPNPNPTKVKIQQERATLIISSINFLNLFVY